MTDVLPALRDWGCDVAGAMERMAGDPDFYLDCLREVAEDPYFERLKQALDAGELAAAFDAAHTLKGVLANVGLTPLYAQITEIVEPLRSGSGDGLEEKYARLMQLRATLRTMIAEKK